MVPMKEKDNLLCDHVQSQFDCSTRVRLVDGSLLELKGVLVYVIFCY